MDAKTVPETEVVTNDVENKTDSSSGTERTKSSDADLRNVEVGSEAETLSGRMETDGRPQHKIFIQNNLSYILIETNINNIKTKSNYLNSSNNDG